MLGRIIVLCGVHKAHKMVFHTRKFLKTGRSCDNWHTFVYLVGIRTDNFGISEYFSQFNCHCTLATTRRTENEERFCSTWNIFVTKVRHTCSFRGYQALKLL